MNPNDIKSRDELYELHDGYADKEGNRCHDDGYRVRDWFEIDAEDRIVNYFGPDSDGVEPTFRDPS